MFSLSTFELECKTGLVQGHEESGEEESGEKKGQLRLLRKRNSLRMRR